MVFSLDSGFLMILFFSKAVLIVKDIKFYLD